MQIIQFSTFSGFPHISINSMLTIIIVSKSYIRKENRFNAPSSATVLMIYLSRVGDRRRLAEIREPSHAVKNASVIHKVKN